MKTEKLLPKVAETLKNGAPIVTAADVENGCVRKIQLYFESDREAVMDVITKDDLVQNFPDEGVFVLVRCTDAPGCELKKLEMFEGKEDMFFRTDGRREEADEFGGVPSVAFMEAVEALCALKL